MGKEKSGIPENRPNLDAERGRHFIPTGGVSSATFNDHSARHEFGGADVITIRGLTNIIVCYEDNVVCNNNQVVYN